MFMHIFYIVCFDSYFVMLLAMLRFSTHSLPVLITSRTSFYIYNIYIFSQRIIVSECLLVLSAFVLLYDDDLE